MSELSKSNSYRGIAKNISIFGGTQCATVLAALARNKVAALTVSVAGVGLNALFNTIVLFISNVVNLGIPFSAVRTLSELVAEHDETALHEAVCRVRRWCLLLASCGALLALLLAPWLSWLYFDDLSQTGSFAALSVVIFMTLLSGGESAIMKSLHRVKSLAWSTLISAIISVVFVVPFYYYWRMEGVIWALVVSSVMSSAQVFLFGIHIHSWRGVFPSGWQHHRMEARIKRFWQTSRPMIILGFAFMVSGIAASGIELLIQSYLATVATMAVLGLYKAGYQLSVTYVGMIFTAMGSDFYPRLSAVNHHLDRRNLLVNRQIAVTLMFVVPIVVLFEFLVPYLIPLLLSQEFQGVAPMARWAILALFFKSLSLPVAYLSLAMGRSLHFLLLEVSSCVMLAACVLLFYHIGGVDATGQGILVSQILELTFVYTFCHHKYGFCFSRQVLGGALVGLLLVGGLVGVIVAGPSI